MHYGRPVLFYFGNFCATLSLQSVQHFVERQKVFWVGGKFAMSAGDYMKGEIFEFNPTTLAIARLGTLLSFG